MLISHNHSKYPLVVVTRYHFKAVLDCSPFPFRGVTVPATTALNFPEVQIQSVANLIKQEITVQTEQMELTGEMPEDRVQYLNFFFLCLSSD